MTEYALVAANTIYNTGTGSQKYPVYIAPLANGAVRAVHILDNAAKGHDTSDFPAGTWPNDFTLRHVAIARTTSATATFPVIGTLENVSACYLRTAIAARSTTGVDRAAYERSAVVYRNGGTAAIQGAVLAPLLSRAPQGGTPPSS